MVIGASSALWEEAGGGGCGGARSLQDWLGRQTGLLASDDLTTRRSALGIIHQLSQDPRADASLLDQVLSPSHCQCATRPGAVRVIASAAGSRLRAVAVRVTPS